MRENELLGLTWGDVDLKDSKIHVRALLSRPKRNEPAKRVGVKTDSTRTIDIDSKLVAFLKSHREAAFAAGRASTSDYVFCGEGGNPLHFRSLGKAFTKAAGKAGLNPDGKRKLRFHDLRRTYASVLINGGCDVSHVAQQLGHSPAVLLSTYTGLFNSRSQAEKGLAAVRAAREGVS